MEGVEPAPSSYTVIVIVENPLQALNVGISNAAHVGRVVEVKLKLVLLPGTRIVLSV